MKETVYLVGGAVRDELLGLPVHERDWVVTGSTPAQLKKQGYRQVGSSFPVFLHPETSEEYALARTEQKQGHGYHGFTVDFHPGVTLEEDLERRDLTINAMAKTDNGEIIDPFDGQSDLDKRLLRHVSPAFAEDPLRVLRVARFAARFAPLGFQVHPDTMALMQQITESGELQHLVAERTWAEICGGLDTTQPATFLQVLRDCGALKELLPEVDQLFGVPQPKKHHPEIDTGIHLQMALNVAASKGVGTEVRFAVLLHDLGKGVTDPALWPAHRGHEKTGLPLVEAVCERLRTPVLFRELALAVCALHLKLHQVGQLRPASILKLLEEAGLIRRPDRLRAFVQACEADYLGRKDLSDRPYPQGEQLRGALSAVLAVSAADLDLEGLDGKAIGEKMRQARIDAIALLPH